MAVRKLEALSAAQAFSASGLRSLLAEWHVDLPDLMPDFLPPPLCFSDALSSSVLCHVRMEEMECRFHVSYAAEQDTDLYRFRALLLRLEARWLKGQLRDIISRIGSDEDARMLMCTVFDEVYATGVQMDEALACGFSEELCGQLKGALASLYLELTVDFGHLMADDDYVDFRHLMDDVCYRHCLDEDKLLEYDILQAGNRVKRLVSAGISTEHEAEAMQLYGELVSLLERRAEGVADGACFWQGMVALENYCFLMHSDYIEKSGLSYAQLVDGQWMDTCMNTLRTERYVGHLSCAEARTALEWTLQKLDEPCLCFLSAGVDCEISLPRRLRDILLHQQVLYEQNYGRSFLPVDAEEKLSVKQVQAQPGGALNEGEIHVVLAFLPAVPVGGTLPLMSREHVRWLEEDFIAFLRGGAGEKIRVRKVEIRAGYAEVLYGLFFHYQKKRKCDKQRLALFLVSELAVDARAESLVSNCWRYIKKYEEFVAENGSHLIA